MILPKHSGFRIFFPAGSVEIAPVKLALLVAAVIVTLPNGNTRTNNWVNQRSGPIDPNTAPVQALAIMPDKAVVWALRSWTKPDVGPAMTIQLLETLEVPENVHFGSLK